MRGDKGCDKCWDDDAIVKCGARKTSDDHAAGSVNMSFGCAEGVGIHS